MLETTRHDARREPTAFLYATEKEDYVPQQRVLATDSRLLSCLWPFRRSVRLVLPIWLWRLENRDPNRPEERQREYRKGVFNNK